MSGLERLKSFARSPHHLWLAALALGGGLASAHPVGLVVGAAVYVLGWIYLPDSGLLRRWRGKRLAATADESPEARERAGRLRELRGRLFASLIPPRQERYRELAAVAEEIEAYLSALPARDQILSPALQMQPLDSLMATFLRLLHTGQILESLLAREQTENLKDEAGRVRDELAELEGRAGEGGGTGTDALVESRRAKLETLEKRLAKIHEAEAKLRLTRAELERVEELVKLARADLVTSQDPAALRHQIDAGARQMADQSTWTTAWEHTDIDPSFDLAPGARVGFRLHEP